VHAHADRTEFAAEILESLHEQTPDDDRVALHLARCYQEQGEFRKCRKLVEYLAGQVIPRQSRHVLKASVWYAEGNFARALEELLLAEQSAPDDPGIHCKIGQVYLRLQNSAEAVRAFSRALSLDANVAHAHHGLAIAFIEQGRYEDAAQSARRSVGLAYHYPAAHFHLGVALACSERPREAARALETCVAQQPRLAEGHAWLARLYDGELGDPDRAERHRMLARGPGSIELHKASLDAMMGAD
jgi:Flp pilus assembly protein TadD